MKNKKKIFCLIMSAMLLLPVIPIHTWADEQDDNEYYNQEVNQDLLDAYVDAMFGEGFAANQREALEIAQRISEALDLESAFAGRGEFPDYFGGMYIDENGRRVEDSLYIGTNRFTR